MNYIERGWLKEYHQTIRRVAAEHVGENPLNSEKTKKQYVYWLRELRRTFPPHQYKVTWE